MGEKESWYLNKEGTRLFAKCKGAHDVEVRPEHQSAAERQLFATLQQVKKLEAKLAAIVTEPEATDTIQPDESETKVTTPADTESLATPHGQLTTASEEMAQGDEPPQGGDPGPAERELTKEERLEAGRLKHEAEQRARDEASNTEGGGEQAGNTTE